MGGDMPLQQRQIAHVQITQQSLVEKMTDKLKQMGDRLSQVEQYKQLCERRITDLDPTHSFPCPLHTHWEENYST